MTQAVMTVAVIAARLGVDGVLSPVTPRIFAPIAGQRPAAGLVIAAGNRKL